MRLGRSGTVRIGRSGTADSDYRERPTPGNPQKTARNRDSSNHPNREESFGFLLTADALVDPDHQGTGCKVVAVVPIDDSPTAIPSHVPCGMIVIDPACSDRSRDQGRRATEPLASVRRVFAPPFPDMLGAPESLPGERS